MDLMALPLTCCMLWALTHPGPALAYLRPKLPACYVVAWAPVRVQQAEHPWETRLRRLEAEHAKSQAVSELAIKEAKDIIKNRTDRIEELERKVREMQQVDADGLASKADEAKEKADAIEAKVKAVAEQVNPWGWEELVKALGGPAVVLGVLLPLVLGNRNSVLKRELEERGLIARSDDSDSTPRKPPANL